LQLPANFFFGTSSPSFVVAAELAVPSAEVQTNNNANKQTNKQTKNKLLKR
jgi:hypothetical protein